MCIIRTKNLFHVTPLLLIAILLGMTLCMGCLKRTPSHQTPPVWINTPPEKHYVGSAYYGIETEEGARRNSVADAINSLLPLKAGVAMVSSDIRQKVESKFTDSKETVQATASISTNATIDGKDININIRIIEFWKNPKKGAVYVLVQDLDP